MSQYLPQTSNIACNLEISFTLYYMPDYILHHLCYITYYPLFSMKMTCSFLCMVSTLIYKMSQLHCYSVNYSDHVTICCRLYMLYYLFNTIFVILHPIQYVTCNPLPVNLFLSFLNFAGFNFIQVKEKTKGQRRLLCLN